jgi:hypothetical protein
VTYLSLDDPGYFGVGGIDGIEGIEGIDDPWPLNSITPWGLSTSTIFTSDSTVLGFG